MHTNIKTFEDACAALGIENPVLPDFSMFREKHRPGMLAHAKLAVIALALNEGWEPDWNDEDQSKYYPFFNMQGAFSYNVYDYFCQHSIVGSRLCFKSRALAEYAGNQFLDLYKEYFTIPQ